jgi:glucosamine-6-phosphate deaminase
MQLKLFKTSTSLAHAAAEHAAAAIRSAIVDHGSARIVVATGASQFPFLESLTKIRDIDWNQVEAFHLDEYVGMPITHPASFRKMVLERLVERTGISKYHLVEGDAPDLASTVRELGTKLTAAPIDVAFIGIGENGHIAFNDPPADFETEDPYIVVELDEACRRQQVGEGWFAKLSQVPRRAISMSPRQILRAREIITIVPDQRKAQPVKLCLEGEIRPQAPASILRRHPKVTVYLDPDSASLLNATLRTALERDAQVTLSSDCS